MKTNYKSENIIYYQMNGHRKNTNSGSTDPTNQKQSSNANRESNGNFETLDDVQQNYKSERIMEKIGQFLFGPERLQKTEASPDRSLSERTSSLKYSETKPKDDKLIKITQLDFKQSSRYQPRKHQNHLNPSKQPLNLQKREWRSPLSRSPPKPKPRQPILLQPKPKPKTNVAKQSLSKESSTMTMIHATLSPNKEQLSDRYYHDRLKRRSMKAFKILGKIRHQKVHRASLHFLSKFASKWFTAYKKDQSHDKVQAAREQLSLQVLRKVFFSWFVTISSKSYKQRKTFKQIGNRFRKLHLFSLGFRTWQLYVHMFKKKKNLKGLNDVSNKRSQQYF